ncbi:MAG: NAD-dependent DNA ligase LigA [Acholeplasmataceae bacterium]
MNKVYERILELRKEINHANYMYHTKDKPLISDLEYDKLLKELIDLEEKHPEYDSDTSPSKKIGGTILDGFKKYQHESRMMSLSNVFNFEELETFYNRISPLTNEFTTELKIDGLAVSLIYKSGKFVAAATRGDGSVGEDVTNNVKTIKSLPLLLNEEIDIIIRGEIYLSHHEFMKINDSRINENLEIFANPRNAAAGTIRQLDSSVVAKRNLSLFVYNVVNPNQYKNTQYEILNYLKELGFSVNPYFKLANNLEELKLHINEYDEIRKTLPYDTDGVVIKVNDFKYYEEIGYTAKAPKYATAYKYQTERAMTKINDITFQVGRTGVITPVAELEPVFVSGSLISRATLHNEDYIKSKDIRINDYVLVHKAGEIIPEVISVILEKRKNNKPFEMIKNCPICNFPLERKEGEADYYCNNPDCPGKNIYSLIHFAHKGAMDIDGLGEKVMETLHDLTYIKNIPDIYKLKDHRNELILLKGFGIKKVDKLLNAIEESKKISFDRFIFGLGIKHVGERVSKILTNKFNTIDSLIDANYDDLINLDDIGPEIANSVINYFENDANLKMLEELKSFNLNLESEKVEIKEHLFNNKTFVLTGSLNNYTRKEASLIIEKLGGKVSSSVSSNTDYLLSGEASGSKLKKALELNIKIINEEEFERLIK